MSVCYKAKMHCPGWYKIAQSDGENAEFDDVADIVGGWCIEQFGIDNKVWFHMGVMFTFTDPNAEFAFRMRWC